MSARSRPGPPSPRIRDLLGADEQASIVTALNETAESGQASPGELAPDAAGAIRFLERWMNGSEPRSLLVSIVPDSPTTHGHTFDLPGDDAMAQWIERSNRVAGVYWAVNACKPDLTKKARKADVEWLLGIWGDLDPIKGRDLAEEHDRLHRLAGELMGLPWPPTVIISSGGGIQPLWRLETPLEATQEFRQAIEVLGRRIEAALGGIENTSNADRVLRLPFTINHPNRIKIDQGRVPVMSGILAECGVRYPWRDLEALATHLEDEPLENAVPVELQPRGYVNGASVQLEGLPDYPTEEQIEALLENHDNLRLIWNKTTLCPPSDTSASGWDQKWASTLASMGFPPGQVASYLRAFRLHQEPEKAKQDRADYILRTVERAQPADAHLGEDPEPGGEQDGCPPGDGPSYEAGRRSGAGQQTTAGDAQGRNRGTFKTGSTQPKAPGWPEPGELGRLDPAPEFPTRFLPPFLRQWVETQADNMGCPVDLLAIPSLVTIAGCIGRQATLRPKRHDWSWSERPCVWGAIVAPKGALKSPSLMLATAPLRVAEARYREAWKEDLAAWEARQEARKGKGKGKDGNGTPDDPKPLEPKMVTSDTTIEALADAMVESRGMTLICDELSSWVDNMSRYNSGNDRKFYLQAHSGGPHTVDRILRGRQIVPDCYLSVIGGIQPQVAKKAFSLSAENLDDGFFERFGLISYPEVPNWQGVRDRESERDYKQLVMEACLRLAEKDWLRDDILGDRPMVFLEEAQDRFLEWYDHHMREHVANHAARDRPEHGFMSKGPGLVVRLSIVTHLFRWTCGEFDNSRAVDLKSLSSAIGIFETYCKPMYARILQAFGQVKGQSGAERIAAMILKKRLAKICPSDVRKMGWQGLREREDIFQAFAALEDIDWIVPQAASKSTPKGGRPAEAWLVNPKVHQMRHNFGEQK
jgi:Protein of unknown function (DUF3987)